MKRALFARVDALAPRAARLPLRSGIPLLLLVFALAVSATVALHHADGKLHETEDAARDALALRASGLQSTLEAFYRNGMGDNARADLAQASVQRGHRVAAVIDENGRVVAASRSMLLGEPGEAALPRLARNADLLAAAPLVRAQRSGLTRLGAAGDSVAALFPLTLEGGRDASGPERIGLLFVEHDLAEAKALVRAEARANALKLTVTIVLLAVLLWLFLHVVLTRRARRLVATARQIAAGSLVARSGVSGNDELGHIGAAFDAMAARLEATQGQLQAALEAAHMLVWQMDLDTGQVACTRIESASEAVTGDFATFVAGLHPDDRAGFEAALRAVRDGREHVELEYRRPDAAGNWHWYALRGRIEAASGTPRRATGVAWDIAERKAAEIELAAYRDRLEEQVAARTAELARANQELEAFSYSASHDLQAPLRSMRGFSEIVLEEYGGQLDAPGRSHLERIVRAAGRMSRMVEDLLAFSRSTRGALRRTAVDLSELAEEIAAELRARDPARRSEWHITPGIVAEGDPSLLQSVLANLLGNAWKYSGERDVALIGFAVRDGDGERIYCVRDNGVGFEPEQAAKVFEPFQRLHSQDRFEGSGIGLATARRIVERHGGRIWAEASPGNGAVFCFTLGAAAPPRPTAA